MAIGSGCLNCLVSSDHTKGLIYAIFARHLRKLEDISSWALQMYVLFNVMCFLFLGAPKTKNIYIYIYIFFYINILRFQTTGSQTSAKWNTLSDSLSHGSIYSVWEDM